MNSLTIFSIQDRLAQQFNILGLFNMVEFGPNMSGLYHSLLHLRKEKFSANDRIIFDFSETDYYFENQFGIFLMNTYRIIDYLQIPTFCCLILTQQDYIKSNVAYLNRTYFPYDAPIKTIEVYRDHVDILTSIPAVSSNVDAIKKSFVYLSGQNRKHRTLFFSLLNNDNLLKNGDVSFRLAPSLNRLESNQTGQFSIDNLPDDLELVTLSIPRACNENWYINDSNAMEIYNNFLINSPDSFIFKNFNEVTLSNASLQPTNVSLVQESFLYISAETVFNYPGCFLTEKSFKGIISKRPFVILGAARSLSKLKEYGFKTFDQWIDESYDQIDDNTDRLLAVFNIVKNISNKPISELKDICNDMADVLEYNYNHLINNFVNLQLDKFDKQCSE